jgi:hypothetical protein
MTTFGRVTNSYRAFISGFLIVFAVGVLIEFANDWLLVLIALFVIAIGLRLAKYAAAHFHGGHTHVGDSAIDIVAIGALVLANILHPMVDGFSFYETMINNPAVGALFGLSIIGHEILRQWALVEAIREHIKRPVFLIVSTAILGIAAGIGIGFFGTKITEGHERIADLATIFAYTFIVGEFYFAGHGTSKKYSKWFVLVGLLVGAFLTFFLQTH